MPTTSDVNINNVNILMPDYELLKKVRSANKDDVPLTFSKKLHLNAKNEKSGMTPLLYAILKKHNKTAEKLIYYGADVNEPDNYGMTPLMYAIFYEHNNTAKKLIDRYADVNEPDNSGKTPLMYASDNCNLEMVKLLINKGANVEAKSHSLTAKLIASYKLENAENAKDKDMIDKCGEVFDLFNIALKKKHGGRRLKRRATKKNRRVSKSKRYTRAKQ